MRKILLGVLLTLTVWLAVQYFANKHNDNTSTNHSVLLQEQIKNVGKLVVTEGHFSEVYTYKNSKLLFGDFYNAQKKAIVIVNANVTVSYDLSQLKYTIDESNKILTLTQLPEAELTINPNLKYYDIEADYLNPFQAKDYNTISEDINAILLKKIEASTLKSNAKNRLVSELSKFYILTNSLGWTLQYNTTPIRSNQDINRVVPLLEK